MYRALGLKFRIKDKQNTGRVSSRYMFMDEQRTERFILGPNFFLFSSRIKFYKISMIFQT